MSSFVSPSSFVYSLTKIIVLGLWLHNWLLWEWLQIKNKKIISLFQEQMSSKRRWSLKETKMFLACKYFYDKTTSIERCILCEICWQISTSEESWYHYLPPELALRREYSRLRFSWERRKSEFCILMLLYFGQGTECPSCLNANHCQGGGSPHTILTWIAQWKATEESQQRCSTQTEDHCPSVRTGHLLQGGGSITQRAIFIHDLLSDSHLATAWERGT